ncbi:uncharacterized protein KY384_007340 [Bacidia gigantensis]|uniref:uncharacterized protein n=1 Tax=Bacidia gigantensis TaxID=2732470 RepID=UPI001D0392D8|nr:uncharacterized protein KY384_007340 [Bacidia gigantensis]KAG8528422.1 hypothetical protein KY384_007340 [Bacidia gigantensis]
MDNLPLELFEQIILCLTFGPEIQSSCTDLLALSLTDHRYHAITAPYLAAQLDAILNSTDRPPWVVFPEVVTKALPFPPNRREVVRTMNEYMDSILSPFSCHVPPKMAPGFQAWAFRKTAPREPYLLPCAKNGFRWVSPQAHERAFWTVEDCKRSEVEGNWIEGISQHDLDSNQPAEAMCIEYKKTASTIDVTLRYLEELNAIELSVKEMDGRVLGQEKEWWKCDLRRRRQEFDIGVDALAYSRLEFTGDSPVKLNSQLGQTGRNNVL